MAHCEQRMGNVMHRTLTKSSVLVLSSILGCSGETADTQGANAVGGKPSTGTQPLASGGSAGTGIVAMATGGTGGTPQACSSANCCVPVTLSASNVSVYQVDGSISVALLVTRTGAVANGVAWSAVAKVTTPWGGTQDCPTYPSAVGASDAYYLIQCPKVTPTSSVSCGSNGEISVQLGSNTYSDYSTSSPSCVGNSNLGLTLTYTAPVKCPTCPPTSPSFDRQSCDEPPDASCSYLSALYGGGTGLLPCFCSVNQSTGSRIWSCAVS